MIRHGVIAGLVLVGACLSAQARANDTQANIAMGGLIF
jgi:hypothetical protein